MAVAIFLATNDEGNKDVGISKASDTCVRLEPSPLSPGVASINFDAVVDLGEASTARPHLYQTVVQPLVLSALAGRRATIVAAGCASSGKSTLLHGLTLGRGVIELALSDLYDAVQRRVQDNPDAVYLIEMSCLLLDESTNGDDDELRESYLGVRSIDDAIKLYQRSIVASNGDGKRHASVAVRVEVLEDYSNDNNAVRTALVGSIRFIDVAGSSMIAVPQSVKPGNVEYFGVSRTLSKHFSSHLLAPYTTCLLLGLRIPRVQQQQAIQSLLYACRIKDLPAVSATPASASTTLLKLAAWMETDIWLPTERDAMKKLLPKVLCHTESAWQLKAQTVLPYLFIKSALPSPILSRASTNAGETSSEDDEKQPILDSSRSVLEAIDALFGSVGQDHGRSAASATPISKLRMIHSWWKETHDGLVDEEAVTLKCSSRLQKLQACIQTQRAQINVILAEKRSLQEELSQSQDKLLAVSSVVQQLQDDVATMKRKMRPSTGEDAIAAQFSARLTKVIDDTKQVVAMKDAQIAQLEASLREACSKTDALPPNDLSNEAAVANEKLEMERAWAAERSRLEADASDLRKQLHDASAHSVPIAKMQAMRTRLQTAQSKLEAATQTLSTKEREWSAKERQFESAQKDLVAQIDALTTSNKALATQIAALNATRDLERQTQQECIDTIEKLTSMCQRLERQVADDGDARQAQTLQHQYKAAAFQAALAQSHVEAEARADELAHLRRREEHLVQALAVSNEHESRAKQQVRALEAQVDEIHRLRREHFHLHAVLNTQEHKLRVLERQR
ncbi:hypothetical protein SPRG_01892 [Saprolegnia parasitica CBS 223.65]|uniref:Kinesin motor domain-containing protein n=1 Tax=Saprolegnia parasitica (strain CBS 223.65) TaxID=695850 RepID=A0A067D234_SAPPC|nr:hypothetical protein SPRG_01892 [Saprolegnia parasitica CBS 223.65]KDO33077.1 hypothetical protein SPRG_01892 [Saprolegnia parasitica CBS 223.65]|eukprot:XP_012195848.1 hypothetical protein SPRG_01892 [Saprolegnia parasitica CBS 223.65]